MKIKKAFALGFWVNKSEFMILTPAENEYVHTIFEKKEDAEKWGKKYDVKYEVIPIEIHVTNQDEQVFDMTIAEVSKALGKKIRVV